MSEKITLSKNDVKNSQVAKIEETLNDFNVDENRNYLKLCKQNSEVNFQSKNLQTFDSSNKMDEINREYCELTSVIKLTNHSLNEHLISVAFENFNENLKNQNAALFYQLASIFNLPGLQITVLRYIERCFSMIVESDNFLDLDLENVSKILASSSLQIDSEVEVYNAANKWLNHNSGERRKLARNLLLKVRLNLLSERVLKYLQNESSCISKNNECVEMLNNRNNQNQNIIYSKSRHCNQNMFNILICGGLDVRPIRSVNQVKEFNGNNLKKLKDPPLMLKERYSSKAVYLKGEVYLFGGKGLAAKPLKSVEKYSPVSKTWNYVCDLPDERQEFSACSFIDKIFLFGGFDLIPINSCIHFDAKTIKWKEVAKMNEQRSDSACALFEGNIVVSGGYNYDNNNFKSVELYDVFANAWKSMPNMIEERQSHSLVCIKSKLIAIGGNLLNTNCEVFDKISSMFVTLKTPKFRSFIVTAVSIGSKILVFQNESQVVLCYDVDKDEWTEKSCKAIENLCNYSTVTVPLYNV